MDRLARLACEANENRLYYRGGIVPADLRPGDLVTSLFLHLGWWHLVGNLLVLYLVGPWIEDVWGRPSFLAFYLLAGLAAGGLHIAHHPDAYVPMLGASGAIAGVMGAFAVRYARARIRLFFQLHILPGTFTVSAWLLLGVWFAKELLLAQMGAYFGVARWAHIGGFAFGLAVAGAIRLLGVEQRLLEPAIKRRQMERVARPRLEEALEARRRGRNARAWKLLREELREHPDDRSVVLAYWDLAVAGGRVSEAAPAMSRWLARAARKRDLETIQGHWGELVEAVGPERVDPLLLALVAEAFHREEHHFACGDILALAAASPRLVESPGALLRLARVACRAGDPSARELLERAARHPEIPADRLRGLVPPETDEPPGGAIIPPAVGTS